MSIEPIPVVEKTNKVDLSQFKYPFEVLIFKLFEKSFFNRELIEWISSLTSSQVFLIFGLYHSQLLGFSFLTAAFTLNGGTFDEGFDINNPPKEVALIRDIYELIRRTAGTRNPLDSNIKYLIESNTMLNLGLICVNDTPERPMSKILSKEIEQHYAQILELLCERVLLFSNPDAQIYGTKYTDPYERLKSRLLPHYNSLLVANQTLETALKFNDYQP